MFCTVPATLKKKATFQLQTSAQLQLSVFISVWHRIAILTQEVTAVLRRG